MSLVDGFAGIPDPFPLVRYRIEAEVILPVRWPAYEGSTLRGLFGHALRAVACVTGRDQCDGCPMIRRCAYPVLFEPRLPEAVRRTSSDLSPACMILPSRHTTHELAPGDRFHFDVVLIGAARRWLEVMVLAWRRALSAGIGSAGGAARLRSLSLVDNQGACRKLMDDSDLEHTRAIPEHEQDRRLPQMVEGPTVVSIEWITPVRIKRNGKVLDDRNLDGMAVFDAASRRLLEVCRIHLGVEPGLDLQAMRQRAKAIAITASSLRWVSFRRWSNRQGRSIPLAGVSGSMTLVGELTPLWQLLTVGEWLGIGGKTAFGFGHYRLHISPR